MSHRVLGIDPGATGALAFLDEARVLLQVADMPVVIVRNKRQIAENQVASIIRDFRPDVAWIERVHAMPRQGVSSSFNFGVAYGVVRGVLAGCQIPCVMITPQEWKRAFRLGADKQEARLRAANLFPAHAELFKRRCDDGRAEATLLALFGAREPA